MHHHICTHASQQQPAHSQLGCARAAPRRRCCYAAAAPLPTTPAAPGLDLSAMPTEVVKCSAGAIRDGSDGKLTVGCVNPSPTHPHPTLPRTKCGQQRCCRRCWAWCPAPSWRDLPQPRPTPSPVLKPVADQLLGHPRARAAHPPRAGVRLRRLRRRQGALRAGRAGCRGLCDAPQHPNPTHPHA